MIPLHVIDAIGDSTLRHIDVWSPDTDVLILLMNLVAHGRLGAFTKLNILTGKGDKYRSINIRECHWAREVSRSDWFSLLHRRRLGREICWHLKEELDNLVPILAQ